MMQVKFFLGCWIPLLLFFQCLFVLANTPAFADDTSVDSCKILTFNTYLLHVGGAAPDRLARARAIAGATFMKGA